MNNGVKGMSKCKFCGSLYQSGNVCTNCKLVIGNAGSKATGITATSTLMKLTNDQKLEFVVNKLGTQNQLKKTIEEMAELIVELSKTLDNNERTDKLIDELADVQVMLDTLINVVYKKYKKAIDEVYNNKIERIYNKCSSEFSHLHLYR